MKCPKCSSSNIKSEGNRSLYSKSVNFDFFVCEDCGFQFAENPATPHPSPEPKTALPSREELLEKIRQKHQVEDLRQEKINAFAGEVALPHPPLFTALKASVKNSPGDVSAHVQVLQQVPISANRLLNLVNCPDFFDDKTADDFSDLFQKFPHEELLHLLLAIEMVDLIHLPPDVPVSRQDFWRRELAIGLSAHAIARFLGENGAESFFVAGVFNHIGRLAIVIRQPELEKRAQAQSRNSRTPLFETEERLLGFNHSQVGGALLRQWEFKETLIEGVIHYRNPHKCRLPSQEAHTLHISEIIASDLKLGNTGEPFPPKPDMKSVKILGITRSMLATIKESVLSRINDIQGIFLP